jgi:cation diffusion facilitator CzcD-associated flavoprotein CzcO
LQRQAGGIHGARQCQHAVRADIGQAKNAGTAAQSGALDALIIGAGFSGLYQLHCLRDRLGLSVRVLEAGEGVGGTWYWNRYPGARVDSQAYIYQYWFSDELLKEWNWSERFPAQEETERYLNHVADRFHLRKDIQFGTRVTGAAYNEATKRWTCKSSWIAMVFGVAPMKKARCFSTSTSM